MKIIILTLFISCSFKAYAQTIPSDRVTDWTFAGYPNTIPSPANILDVTLFGATGNGTTDDVNAIRDAIDSLNGTLGVIYFPPGNYLIGSTLDLPDSVILRGSSVDSTHLIFNLGGAIGNGFHVAGSESGVFTSVLSDAIRGSNFIVVDDPTSFAAGNYAELLENNGSWDIQPAPWADNSVGQILHLSNVNGDTLFFDAPLRISFDSALFVRVQKITPAVEVGIECMRISRADNVAAGVCYNIYYIFAANCWINGVESSMSVGSHIEADASTNITIKGCYIHHAFAYDGSSTHGYGLTLFDHTGQCLIENNIMEHLRHSFSLQTGANGNVFAFNFSRDPNRSEFPTDYGADISLHGHFPFANLFEGNIVQNIIIDQTWGPSGPLNTFFRNRADLYGIIMTSASDTMNFVGNEVTNTNSFMGQYTLSGNGHFAFGNNIKGTIMPSGTSPLPDTSYYLIQPPAYWNSSIFPSIGIPNVISSGSNPARDRYLLGASRAVCNDDIINSIEKVKEEDFDIFPNPSNGNITVKVQNSLFKNGIVIIKDLQGKNVYQTQFENTSEIILNLSDKINKGIYLIEIKLDGSRMVKKIILM